MNMNILLFDLACINLSQANGCNIIAKYQLNSEDKFSRCLNTIMQGMALGILVALGLELASQRMLSLGTRVLISLAIPFTFALTINGLESIAHRTGYFSHEMKALNENIGKYMDIATRISSVMFLILLAPQAPLSPFIFGLTALGIVSNSLVRLSGHRAGRFGLWIES